MYDDVDGGGGGSGDVDGSSSYVVHPHEGARVRLQGTVRTVRKQKRRAFAALDDGSSARSVQAVFEAGADGDGVGREGGSVGGGVEGAGIAGVAASAGGAGGRGGADLRQMLADVTVGAAVDVVGIWRRCPGGKEQSHELAVERVVVVGAGDPAVCLFPWSIYLSIYLWTGMHECDVLTDIDEPDPKEIPDPRLPPHTAPSAPAHAVPRAAVATTFRMSVAGIARV